MYYHKNNTLTPKLVTKTVFISLSYDLLVIPTAAQLRKIAIKREHRIHFQFENPI